MPKKTPEEIRNQVVQMRQAGATYTSIESTLTKEGTPISRPTTIKILKEAGLTKSARAAPVTVASKSAPMPTATPSVSARVSIPVGRGVDELMPKQAAAKQAQPTEFECDNCGAEFTADGPEDLPESCPECGA